MLIRREQSFLLIVDIQERLAPTILNAKEVVTNVKKLIRAAGHFSIPLLVSEQYPKGLGQTLPELRELVAPENVFEKTHFSCVGEAGFAKRLIQARRQIILCGMEAHVCVLQTALDLAASGWAPVVVADGVSSRRAQDRDLGLMRVRDAGTTIVTAEMVLFEWIGQAGTADFKTLLPLIR